MKPFRQPARNQPDDTFMPIRRAHDEERHIRPRIYESVGFGQRLLKHLRLDRASFLVQPVQQQRDASGLDLVLAGKEPRTQCRVADTAAGIDTRAQNEA